mmetsp:Transcript_29838/g.69392  ORF Transcript_29838/g.69392 Transcript_29838/m.69392 type:complete len:997 (-) Transcript_29838:108-3098(-)
MATLLVASSCRELQDEGGDDFEEIDAAIGRVLQAVEDAVERASVAFEEALSGDTPMDGNDRWREELTRQDLELIQRAGEDDQIIEVVLERLSCTLRTRLVPKMWRTIGQAQQGRFPSGWRQRFHRGFRVLCQLQLAHVGLLQNLSQRHLGSHFSVEQYKVHLRVAVRESWPQGLADELQHYMNECWQSANKVMPERLTSTAATDEVEWWWAAHRGKEAPSGASNRVLCLLDPSRQPVVPGQSSGSDAQPLHVGGDSEEVNIEEFSDMELEEEKANDVHMGAGDSVDHHHEAMVADFEAVSKDMLSLGLGDVWRDMAMRSLLDNDQRFQLEGCAADVTCSVLQKMTRRMYKFVLRWLRLVFGLPAWASSSLSSDKEQLEVECMWWLAARQTVVHFFELSLQVRLKQAFDMVRDFPDSMPALVDLRRCLAQTRNSGLLVQVLRQQLSRRLLIAGAHTRDVIKVYIKTIKAMRLIDPRGLLLEAVSPPTRAYLRRRKDTVRCIVTALTEDSDLQQELQSGAEVHRRSNETKGGALTDASAVRPADGAAQGGESLDWQLTGGDFDISDDEDPDSWVPDPLDADPLRPSNRRRAQDVISLLVGIYGSKEMFIKEYKDMLADRLLGMASYGTDKEAQNLELLKTRFGEASLTDCDVMLHDIKDSRRVNMNIHQQEAKPQASVSLSQQRPPLGSAMDLSGSSQNSRQFVAPFSLSSIFGLCTSPSEAGSGVEASSRHMPLENMHALILSKHYWPSALAKEDYPNMRLPNVLEQSLAEYGSHYSKVRSKRSLTWKRTHGLVEVEVQLKDRSLSVVVGPVHLAVLSCFTDDSQDGDSSTLTAGSAPSTGPGQHSTPCVRSLQEVAGMLELPEALVRRRIGFWVSKEVLREVSSGVFEVQECGNSAEQSDDKGHVHMDDEGTTGTAAADLGGACARELEECKALLQGIFTTHTSLPLSRVHNFLQMFMMDPPYTQTEAQLKVFLAKLCREGRLECDGTNYSLARKT